MEWAIPEIREWFLGLGRGRRLVRYDARGQGLSQRDIEDFTLENELNDFRAVRGRLPPEPLVLVAAGWRIPTAIAYAAAHPADVRAIVLWDPDTLNLGANHPLFATWLTRLLGCGLRLGRLVGRLPDDLRGQGVGVGRALALP